MKSARITELLGAFLEARRLLAAPDNDFSWSSWEGCADAFRQIDNVIAELQAGRSPDALKMRALFAPAGPIQEVSIGSGWGDEFLALADAFDAAIAK